MASSRTSQNGTPNASTSKIPPVPEPSLRRTKILLLGMRRAGKTSIQQVLFNDLPPKQTFYVESTMKIVKHTYDTIIPLEIWDCPGNITAENVGVSLAEFTTVIFVIDIRDVYNQPISKLVEFITAFYDVNPTVNFEVFVHKAEKLQDDDKYGPCNPSSDLHCNAKLNWHTRSSFFPIRELQTDQ
jgi:Ras-related GTP-binding protein C/D